jgi:hypothetical protein
METATTHEERYAQYAQETYETIRAGLKAWDDIDNYLPLATPRELKNAIQTALVGGLNMSQDILRITKKEK